MSIALAGCGGGGGGVANGSTAAAPLPTPFSSANAVAFAGAAQDSLDGTGTFSIAYVQSGSTVNGSWGVVYANTTEWVNGGSFTGTLSGSTLSGIGTSDVVGLSGSECSLSINATLTGTTSMTGGYVGSNCNADTASFTATAFTIPSVGSYSGTIDNTQVPASGTLSVALTQYNVFLNGTYTDAFPAATGYNATNQPAYGVVTGASSVGYYLLVPGTGVGCPLVLTGTLSGGAVTGSFGSQACTQNEIGTFDL